MQFDSSYDRGRPLSFKVGAGQVFPNRFRSHGLNYIGGIDLHWWHRIFFSRHKFITTALQATVEISLVMNPSLAVDAAVCRAVVRIVP